MDEQNEISVSSKKFCNKSIIAFAIFIIMIVAAVFAWKWLRNQPQVAGAQKPLRKGLAVNEKVFSKTFSNDHLAKTYPVSAAAKNVRVNSLIGLKTPVDSSWRLKVVRSAGDTLFISLDDLKSLRKTEITYDFKCIEGWSQISHWGGVKFTDFAKKYNLGLQTQMNYVGLSTPDKKYYVGIDMASMMHPQTILAYEMNNKPLPINHGYPLRLIIPVKYGIKNLKRIGTMYFSNTPPPDYWYERGYDYYSGL
jgi:DMSO/TMAO reductase YedYZ molybdopterin-dependent catalytic subunit